MLHGRLWNAAIYSISLVESYTCFLHALKWTSVIVESNFLLKMHVKPVDCKLGAYKGVSKAHLTLFCLEESPRAHLWHDWTRQIWAQRKPGKPRCSLWYHPSWCERAASICCYTFMYDTPAFSASPASGVISLICNIVSFDNTLVPSLLSFWGMFSSSEFGQSV